MTTRPSLSMLQAEDDQRGVLVFDGRSVRNEPNKLDLIDGIQIAKIEYDSLEGVLYIWPTQGDPIIVKNFTLMQSIYNAGSAASKKGLSGSKGFTGYDGLNGQEGAKGPQGYVGGQGSIGRQGIQGRQGIKGYAGTEGDVGEKGDIGREGSFGIRGTSGDKGERGRQGDHGKVNVVISLSTPVNSEDGTLWVEAQPLYVG